MHIMRFTEQSKMTIETDFESFELHPEFKDSARDLIQSESPIRRLRALRNSDPGLEKSVWRKMAQAGWTAVLIPEELGGLGLDLSACASIASAIGESPIPEPFVGAAVLPVAALLRLDAASPLRNTLLSEILSGDTLAGLAWQEISGELEAQSSQTGLERLEEGYRLTGSKKWVAPGPGADGWLVYARLENKPVLVWVGRNDPGVTLQPEQRIDGTLMGSLDFDVELPPQRLIAQGEPARQAVDYALDAGRYIASHELCGIARKVFSDTLQYLKTRVQFDKPIGANQALQHKMVDAYLQVLLLSACLKENWISHAAGEITMANLASRVKSRASDVAVSIARLAVQMHGAIGYTDELDIGLYLKRALNLAAWLGNDKRHKGRFLAEELAQRHQEEDETPAPHVEDKADLNGLDEIEFRRVIRAFLKANYPERLRHVARRLYWHEIKDWYFALSRRGWLAPAWPRRFGGMELPPEKQLIFFEEMEGYGAARLPDQGIINLGPVLIRYGTDAQRQEYLPKILSGEHIWCQGYSEPNAGSDLASLRTQAVPDGDDFVVNGQKIWTTLAHNANHIFALVRTDNDVKKQAGISFLLIDLATPGIRVAPIRNILGDEEYCEVFFDNVRVPQRNLVGELNDGWRIAKDLLGFERIFAGNPQQSLHALSQLTALAHAENLLEDPDFRTHYASLMLDVIDLQCLFSTFAQYVKQGQTLPLSVSLLKIWATETYVSIGRELALRADENGGSADDMAYDDGTVLNSLAPFTHSLITTIYGGTNEIQRNIVAKHVLGMPS